MKLGRCLLVVSQNLACCDTTKHAGQQSHPCGPGGASQEHRGGRAAGSLAAAAAAAATTGLVVRGTAGVALPISLPIALALALAVALAVAAPTIPVSVSGPVPCSSYC